jgi:uncharacterized protein (DUF433 family)
MPKINDRPRIQKSASVLGPSAARKQIKLKRRKAVEIARPGKAIDIPSPFRVRLTSALPVGTPQPKPGTRTMATASSYRQPQRIRRTPGVCGGAPCVGDSRISVWMLEQARRLGATVQSLLADYPTLGREDVEHAWAFAQRHKAEIDAQIRENEAD